MTLPTVVALGEALQAKLKGRRLHSAVFTTFEFDPSFFEQEIVPALLDGAFSHASNLRLVQLEDHLRSLAGGIAVFYDAARLCLTDTGSSRLDIRRVPVRHGKGVFHPKAILLLLEDIAPDADGRHPRTLVVACLSANITKAGWWSNVEAGHIEEIREGHKTNLKDDLLHFLGDLQRAAMRRDLEQPELAGIVKFLRTTEQRAYRSAEGRLLPHFYSGRASVVEFLEDCAGNSLDGMNLEIISPYFDDAPTCHVLEALVDRFAPKEVRVFLPRNDSGDVLCRGDFFDSVCKLPAVSWGALPGALLGMGRGEASRKRFVHAKVYRFFAPNPAREIVFVGSANLTTPAHERGNVECGLLVELPTPKRPDFWMSLESSAKKSFVQCMDEDSASDEEAYCPLDVTFDWQTGKAAVLWDSSQSPPVLKLQANGILIGEVSALASRQWLALDDETSRRLQDSLSRSSLVEVLRPGLAVARVLVHEAGMSHKPSLLKSLSAAEILKYWSLLTADQRTAFLADRGAEITSLGLGDDLVVPLSKLIDKNTVFDRFAGIFHAFGCLEREVISSLHAGKEKVADYRVFGMKYDSLGSLLRRLETEGTGTEPDVEGYVMLLCAKQLCRELKQSFPQYWSGKAIDVRRLESQMNGLGTLRQRLLDTNDADLPAFLEWFDRWFMTRARGPSLVATND